LESTKMNRPRPQILAVDDTPANLLTLGAALEADFDLQIVTSGAMGLAMAVKSPPDLLLLDVMMPEMDGYETCRRIKGDPMLARIPVIFITALADLQDERTGLALGAADYITKPINVDIARQRIHNLLERERLRQEVEQHRDHLEALVEARTLALAIAKDAADTANRAKNAFLGNMSHELRTPLNGIMGMTDLALRRATDPKQQEQLRLAKVSSQRLLAVISDMLDVSKLEAERLTLEAVDFALGGVLEKLSALTERSAAEKGLALTLDAAPDLVQRRFHGDALRLGQILFHLTSNAIKFTDEGSVAVQVALAKETDTGLVLRFEVRDTGIGVPDDAQARLFTPFEQADSTLTRQYGGTGLGLALCKRLTEAMGGGIGVESRPGEGSRFWFTVHLGQGLPLSEGDEVWLVLDAEAALQRQFAGVRVLVVQDEPISRDVSRELLEGAGLRVDLAADGSVAIAMVQRADYGLILMDIQMPKLDGIEAARAIRVLPGQALTPIVAMTASVSGEDKARCLEAGMNDFLAQPVDPEILFATVLRWLNRRLHQKP
jgi:signal transduction histidine kinase